MKIGFDECRICGRWIWRGDGEECCAPCLGFYYGKVNKKRTRRAMIFWFGLSALAVVLAAGILFRINIVQQALPWALILCIVMPVVGHIIFDDSVRDVKIPADGGGEEARDSAEEQTAKAEDKAVAKEQASEDIADIKREHKAELAVVKAEGKKSLADMQREVKKLQSEKTKLNDDMRNMRKTLEYYCARRVLDAYAGEDALRECGGIYVIKNVGDGKVKIGMTDNFARRFSEIQNHCASAGIRKEDVSPVVLVPLDEGKYEVEHAIHHALADRQTAGEWFQLTPEEAVTIVLDHAHERRVGNFKMRTQFSIGDGGDDGGSSGEGALLKQSVRLGVDWKTVTPEEAAEIPHDAKDDDGNTPLHFAAAYSNMQVIKALKSDSYEEENNAWQTPIKLAALHGNMEVVKEWVKFASDLDIFWVAQHVQSKMVVYHVADMVDLISWDEWHDSSGHTPLQCAVLANNAVAAMAFIDSWQYGVDNFGEEYEQSGTCDREDILHFAVENGASRKMVRALLEYGEESNCGIEVNGVDSLGRTPLDYAVSKENQELADELREAGGYTCDEVAGVCFGVNWKMAAPEGLLRMRHEDRGGKFFGTPIHWAARFCTNPKMIDVLVASGADVNEDSYEMEYNEFRQWSREVYEKPIHLAAREGAPAVVQALISAGADVNAVNYKDKTPLDIADERADGGAEVREVLIEAGAVHAADILKKTNRN